MSNIQLAAKVVTELLGSGVQEFCLCAGARNSPFMQFFEKNSHLKAFHFFDERSAAFFALGRIANTQRPVAVITTSGTAAAEMLPAAIEGTYSSLPLMLITSDRPRRFRGTGAPQSIEQVGIFSYYIEVGFDLDEENKHISLKGLSWKKPIHINVSFNEPLIDDEVPHVEVPDKTFRMKFPESFPMDMKDEIQNFIAVHKPLVILSTLPEKARPAVLQFVTKLKAPAYVEGISNLRGLGDLSGITLKAGEKTLPRIFDLHACDSIIRIGGVPTIRFWRDLEDKHKELPVLSLGYNHFTGLSRDVLHYVDLADLGRIDLHYTRQLDDEFWNLDQKYYRKKLELFEKYPRSEVALVNALSKLTSCGSVYLGNSLPVREWDLAADFENAPLRVVANRGANGIDGQISTFLGWARPTTDNWCIVGDLTALYDMTAMWIADQVPNTKYRVVVINNKGGMIFHRMFKKEIYTNRHNLSFEHLARFWNWDYAQWSEVPSAPALSDRQLIEITPDEKQSDAFWDEWDAFE